MQRKRELMAAADAKRLEIRTAQRVRHHVKLAAFLKTVTAQPPLLWLPARHCGDTLLLLEQRQVDLAVWQARLVWLPSCATQPLISQEELAVVCLMLCCKARQSTMYEATERHAHVLIMDLWCASYQGRHMLSVPCTGD